LAPSIGPPVWWVASIGLRLALPLWWVASIGLAPTALMLVLQFEGMASARPAALPSGHRQRGSLSP